MPVGRPVPHEGLDRDELLAALQRHLAGPANPYSILRADSEWWHGSGLPSLSQAELGLCWHLVDWLGLPRHTYAAALAQHSAQRLARSRCFSVRDGNGSFRVNQWQEAEIEAVLRPIYGVLACIKDRDWLVAAGSVDPAPGNADQYVLAAKWGQAHRLQVL
jgi:hypothetical protein